MERRKKGKEEREDEWGGREEEGGERERREERKGKLEKSHSSELGLCDRSPASCVRPACWQFSPLSVNFQTEALLVGAVLFKLQSTFYKQSMSREPLDCGLIYRWPGPRRPWACDRSPHTAKFTAPESDQVQHRQCAPWILTDSDM